MSALAATALALCLTAGPVLAAKPDKAAAVNDAASAPRKATPQERAQIKALEAVHKQYASHVQKENIEGAIRKDIEFHDLIYAASGNPRLVAAASSLREHIYRFRVIYLRDISKAVDVETEHAGILDALRAGQEVDASIFAEKHIRHQMETIIDSMNVKL